MSNPGLKAERLASLISKRRQPFAKKVPLVFREPSRRRNEPEKKIINMGQNS